MAFTVVDYDSFEILDDPAHVEFDVFLESRQNLMPTYKKSLAYHKCTEQDYMEFQTIEPSKERLYQIMKNKNALFCIDAD